LLKATGKENGELGSVKYIELVLVGYLLVHIEEHVASG
jgi:hypothetical protein